MIDLQDNWPDQSNLCLIDLFAGCGGLSLGFMNAGFPILAAFDNWDAAIRVYRKNFKHKIIQLDLSQLNGNFNVFSQLNPNIIIGSPPCQDFSSAGKRQEKGNRSNLTITFAEIVTQIQPQFFVLENVNLFVNSQTYQKARAILENAGYGLSEKVLDASLCGVPQRRKRFFWIGELNGKDDALIPFLNAGLASTPMTVRDYLGNSLGIEHYYRHPRSYQRRAVFSIDEPSPTIRGVNRPIPATYKSHPGDTAPVTPQLRPLTTIERSYLQTFPKSFIFEGSKTDLEQMIGNAVPVKLAEYVANCLLKYLTEEQLQEKILIQSAMSIH